MSTCESRCEPTKISTRLTLATHHIGKGCDRDTYSVESQRKLCGKSPLISSFSLFFLLSLFFFFLLSLFFFFSSFSIFSFFSISFFLFSLFLFLYFSLLFFLPLSSLLFSLSFSCLYFSLERERIFLIIPSFLYLFCPHSYISVSLVTLSLLITLWPITFLPSIHISFLPSIHISFLPSIHISFLLVFFHSELFFRTNHFSPLRFFVTLVSLFEEGREKIRGEKMKGKQKMRKE